jgi:putative component of membrane protein insertase Oxa1/YidC/SpoIIIJ protein YidD
VAARESNRARTSAGQASPVSPILGPCGRFVPSCSEYAIEALRRRTSPGRGERGYVGCVLCTHAVGTHAPNDQCPNSNDQSNGKRQTANGERKHTRHKRYVGCVLCTHAVETLRPSVWVPGTRPAWPFVDPARRADCAVATVRKPVVCCATGPFFLFFSL